MASLDEIISKLNSKSSNLEELIKTLNALSDAKNKAFKEGDPKALLQLSKMEKSIEKVIKAQKNRLKVEEDLKKAHAQGKTLSEEHIRSTEKAIKQEEKAVKSFKVLSAERIKQRKVEEKSLEEYNEALRKHFREHTKTGKVFSALTSGITSLAGKISFGVMAMKAWNRYQEAANIEAEIMIQNFKGMKQESPEKVFVGIGKYGKDMEVVGSATAKAANRIADFSAELAKARGTATRMGADVNAVNETMLKFSRIAGTQNPKALRILTEGAISVSRAMGIDTAEAVEYVQERMDKFGGSATSAIVALDEMHEQAKAMNQAFTNAAGGIDRTVLRSNDLVKVMMEMSRQSNVYAIDQRLVGQILRDSIVRLQAQGESYEMAMRKAEAYTKALTGQAPEWMQIMSGEGIMNEMEKVWGGGGEEGAKRFVEKYGDELDAAKPGLTKKIEEIMGDKTMNRFEKMRLVQELTAQTSVGIKSMNEEILRLSDGTAGSLTVISKQMGVSREVAHSMVQQAKEWKNEQDNINKLMKATPDILAEQLTYGDKAEAARIASIQNEKEKRKYIEESLNLRKKEQLVAEDMRRREEDDVRRVQKKDELQAEIDKYTKEAEDALKKGDQDRAKLSQEMVRRAKAELSQYDAKDTEASEAIRDQYKHLSSVEDITRRNLEEFSQYADATGNSLKATVEELSTVKNLLAAAGIAGLGAIAIRMAGGVGNIEMMLAKLVAGGGGGLGGGGGFADAPGKGQPKGKGGKGGRFGKIGGMAKKFAGGAGSVLKANVIGRLATTAMMAPELIDSYQKGDYKEMAATLAPALASAVGGVIGGGVGVLAGGVGALPGSIGGSMLGDQIGSKVADYIRGSKGSEPPKTTDGVAPEAIAAEHKKPEIVEHPAPPASTAATRPTQPLDGQFIGGLQPDGSAILKIQNMGDVYASARKQERNNIRHN
jgi:hypothetical protein